MKRALGSLLVLAAAAAILFAMQRNSPRYDELTGPIPVAGRMGETVRTRLFDARVERVEFARQLTYRSIAREHVRTTSGLWAIVTVELAARSHSVNVRQAGWVGPQGLQYLLSDRLALAPDQAPMLDPGLPRRVQLVFEIRPDQVGDATLLLSENMFVRLDSEARIALDQLPRAADGSVRILDTYSLMPPKRSP
ncbi:hypothetical protein [Bordetella petrii]|uniref:hypothetical protein n=1 Tax=Bordetella petrii TaxID=94624 RepID=UPI001E61C69C|nr:hypothetical protein [Bordetella petrii]MCD0502696.1 hypothetical protein [Bordetella petrii]